jgi:hypothetical protein
MKSELERALLSICGIRNARTERGVRSATSRQGFPIDAVLMKFADRSNGRFARARSHVPLVSGRPAKRLVVSAHFCSKALW